MNGRDVIPPLGSSLGPLFNNHARAPFFSVSVFLFCPFPFSYTALSCPMQRGADIPEAERTLGCHVKRLPIFFSIVILQSVLSFSKSSELFTLVLTSRGSRIYSTIFGMSLFSGNRRKFIPNRFSWARLQRNTRNTVSKNRARGLEDTLKFALIDRGRPGSVRNINTRQVYLSCERAI